MKAYMAGAAVVLLCLCTGAVAAAQDAGQMRREQYEALCKQRAQHLEWIKTHPMAACWTQNKREKKAQALRRRLFTEFRDITLARLGDMQREMKELAADCSGAPYVSFNTLPIENLQKMASNKELLRMLLMQHPDNAANLSVQTLLELLEEDEALEEYLTDFLLYLRNYQRYPACLAELKQEEARRLVDSGGRERLLDMLAKHCAVYADKQRRVLHIRAWQKELKYSLSSQPMFVSVRKDSVYYAGGR